MAVTVETLEKLERKITLNLPTETIQTEVQARLRKLGKKAKMDGFRPGKIPMSVLAKRYGNEVENEVLNEKLIDAFAKAVNEAKLNVAGKPHITFKEEEVTDGQKAFDAVFEIYPEEIKIGDISTFEIEKISSEISEAAMERTINILRKQHRTFETRDPGAAVQEGDRVTVDFEGKIDGEAFEGGKAEDIQFLVGEKQMLENFEQAVLGMKADESKTFPLTFPEDYAGKNVAGKTADFLVTVKKIEAQCLPEVNEEFVAQLKIAEGTVEALRADVKNSLEREMKKRLMMRNKENVMNALIMHSEMDIPQAPVRADMAYTVEQIYNRMRSGQTLSSSMIPSEDVLRSESEKRVRSYLLVGELARRHETLQPTSAQIEAYVQEIAANYEQPKEVEKWYYSDKQRMTEVTMLVLENNVVEFVLQQAKIAEKTLDFDELMKQ